MFSDPEFKNNFSRFNFQQYDLSQERFPIMNNEGVSIVIWKDDVLRWQKYLGFKHIGGDSPEQLTKTIDIKLKGSEHTGKEYHSTIPDEILYCAIGHTSAEWRELQKWITNKVKSLAGDNYVKTNSQEEIFLQSLIFNNKDNTDSKLIIGAFFYDIMAEVNADLTVIFNDAPPEHLPKILCSLGIALTSFGFESLEEHLIHKSGEPFNQHLLAILEDWLSFFERQSGNTLFSDTRRQSLLEHIHLQNLDISACGILEALKTRTFKHMASSWESGYQLAEFFRSISPVERIVPISRLDTYNLQELQYRQFLAENDFHFQYWSQMLYFQNSDQDLLKQGALGERPLSRFLRFYPDSIFTAQPLHFERQLVIEPLMNQYFHLLINGVKS